MLSNVHANPASLPFSLLPKIKLDFCLLMTVTFLNVLLKKKKKKRAQRLPLKLGDGTPGGLEVATCCRCGEGGKDNLLKLKLD